MGYTTFVQARQWVAPGYGDCTPEVTGEVVNAIREHWYNWYLEVALFLDVVECYAVQTYCLDCNNCRETYRGFTLPREAQNVEALWLNDWPVKLHNSWREYQQGLTNECDCHLTAMDVPGSFSTFRDIPPGRSVELIALALDPSDWGKRITIRGVDTGNRPRTETLGLSGDGVKTTVGFLSIDHRGGIVKDVTNGRVLLMDAEGYKFGQYEPDETVPSYRRMKVSGIGNDCEALNVRSARKFFPLIGDLDVVENDNRMAFDAMARYLRNFRKAEKNRETIIAEKDSLVTARQMILGGKAREEGRATQVDVKIVTPQFKGRVLNRFGGGGWF